VIRWTREPATPDVIWEPTAWWRVVAADGSLWCETSSESEARQYIRSGDKLQRLWEPVAQREWRDAE
jgi:hypothetical protein